MHVLALLCLGIAGNKDRAAAIDAANQMSAHAVAGSTGRSGSDEMVAALAKSQLDLDAFVANPNPCVCVCAGGANTDPRY